MPRQVARDQKTSISGTSVAITRASNASTLQIGDGSNTRYSWGMKFRMSKNTATFPCVIFGKSLTKYPLQFRVETTGLIRAAVYDGTNNPVATNTKSILDYQWHTAVGVRDGSSVSLFLDGIFIATTTATLGNMSEASTITIGGNTFVGNIKNAFITLNAMTAKEVADYHSSDRLLANNLLEYRLDEGAGAIAYDSSGNGNDGTLGSITWSSDTPTKKRKTVNDNMVYNGDFEYAPRVNTAGTPSSHQWLDGTLNGSSNMIFGWMYYNWAGTHQAYFDNTVSHSGNYSLKISTLGASSSAGIRINGISATSHKLNNIPCLPNTSYTFTGWMKTNYVSGDSGMGAYLSVAELKGDGFNYTSGGGLNLSAVKTTTDWTFYTGTFTTKSDARFLAPGVQVTGNTGAGTLIMDAWFDDIVLKPTTPDVRLAVQDMKSSLNFNGFSTTVTATTGIALAQPTISFGGRFKPTKSSNDWILYYGFATSEGGVILVRPDGRVYVKFLNVNGVAKEFYVDSGNYLVNYSRWNHIVATYDGANIKIYADSILRHTLAATGNINLSNSVFTSGSTTAFGAEKDTILYSDALTAKEIQDIYYSGIYPSDNKILGWGFDEGAGSTAYDSSGNGNNGTITNGTWTRDTPTKKRKVVDDNMVYNGDFSIAPVVNVPQTTIGRWLDGTSTGIVVNGINNSTNRVPGIYFYDKAGSGSIMIDTTEKYNGKNSLKLSTTATGSYVMPNMGDLNREDFIILSPNTTYRYSYWLKTNVISGDSNDGAYILFREKTGALSSFNDIHSAKVKATIDWTYYTGTFTTTANTRYVAIFPRVSGHTGAATLIMDAWFADIQLRPTSNNIRAIA